MAIAVKLGSDIHILEGVEDAPYLGEVVRLFTEDMVVTGITRSMCDLPPYMPLVLLTPIGDSVRRERR